MKKTRWLPWTLVVFAAIVVAAGLPSEVEGSLEYRFVQTGSGTTNKAGEEVGYLEGAEIVCTRMSAEGWDLVSSNVVSGVSGRVMVLGFARLEEE